MAVGGAGVYKKGTKSKFAKANAEKSKMQLAAQRVHQTQKKLQQSHDNHAKLAREMAVRETKSEAEKLQKMLERDTAIDNRNAKLLLRRAITCRPDELRGSNRSLIGGW